MIVSLVAAALISVSAPAHGHITPGRVWADIRYLTAEERRVEREWSEAREEFHTARSVVRWMEPRTASEPIQNAITQAFTAALAEGHDRAREHALEHHLAHDRRLLARLTLKVAKTAVAPAPVAAASTQAAKAVEYALSKIGDPYVWGATGPSAFDCSGLVQAAWAAAGVSIPRTTWEQMAALPAVSVAALEPGDLLFFLGGDHVGMYVGNGYLIDAPQTGENVEKVPFAGWFRDNFVSAARP